MLCFQVTRHLRSELSGPHENQVRSRVIWFHNALMEPRPLVWKVLRASIAVLLFGSYIAITAVRNARQNHLNQALFSAVQRQDQREVSRLIDSGADINSSEELQFTF